MKFGVLGPLEVCTDDGRGVQVPEAKVRMLLAEPLAHRGQVVPVGRLIEDLWGGSTFTARPTASLQDKVSQLRRALQDAEAGGGRELVAHRAPGYVLDIPAAALDAGRFRALVAGARAAEEPRARAALYTEALALWRGAAFAGFADQPCVRPTAASLEEERLTAVEEHAHVRLELGEHSLLIGELTELVETYPLREGLRGALMWALYRAGRSSDALAPARHCGGDQGTGRSPAPSRRTGRCGTRLRPRACGGRRGHLRPGVRPGRSQRPRGPGHGGVGPPGHGVSRGTRKPRLRILSHP
ncbi:BTAD domain-containing putative transcriptional regulator [Streptomyces sp. NPDC050287]|uniref:AfsR/SARP family transcriptional regulator n=1 Tax=Streptomyces sp. NPDC050287 TaxID=3365608 RepID=UPI00379BB2C4